MNLNDRLYSDARKALGEALRIDAVTCIQASQRFVSEQLAINGATPALIRVALGDLAEVLLARAAQDVVHRAQAYQALHTNDEREIWLTAHLSAALVQWLLSRVRSVEDVRATLRLKRQLAA